MRFDIRSETQWAVGLSHERRYQAIQQACWMLLDEATWDVPPAALEEARRLLVLVYVHAKACEPEQLPF